MKKIFSKTVLSLLCVGSVHAKTTVTATPPLDVNRFNGHYKLVRQDQGYQKIRNWTCTGLTTCSVGKPTKSDIACDADLYVKGARIEVAYGRGSYIFYSNLPLPSDPTGDIADPPFSNESSAWDTCTLNDDNFMTCAFEKAVGDYKEHAAVSKQNLVTEESYAKSGSNFVSLEKKGGLLIFTSNHDGSSTNGRGYWVKESEYRLKCEYQLSN